jgi:hypothetical protein
MMAPVELEDVNDLTYPVLAAPDFLGLRAYILNGLPIGVPNRAIKDILSGLPNFDGVLVGDEDIYAADGAPKFTFWVYDIQTRTGMPFNQRRELINSFVNASGTTTRAAPYQMIKSSEGLLAFFAAYDKIVIRDPADLVGAWWYMESEDVEKDVPLSLDGYELIPGTGPDEVEPSDIR